MYIYSEQHLFIYLQIIQEGMFCYNSWKHLSVLKIQFGCVKKNEWDVVVVNWISKSIGCVKKNEWKNERMKEKKKKNKKVVPVPNHTN